MSLRFLKYATIILPLVFLAAVDFVRHLVFPSQLHTWAGFLATYLLVAVAVMVFSAAVFGVVGRLQKQTARQNRQLQALNQIAVTAGESLRLDDLLNSTLDRVMELTGASAGIICGLETDRDELVAVCSRGLSPTLVERVRRAKVGADPMGEQAVRTGRPVVIEKLFEDPRVAERARREGFRSAISVPLKVHGEVTGVLALITRVEHVFPPAEISLLTGIGGELGMALRNAKLYEQTRRQADEMAALLVVGQAVTSSLDLQQTLETALSQALAVTGAEAGEVWLVDRSGEVALRARRGASPEAFLERTRFRRGQGLPGLVAESGEPLVIHDLSAEPRFLRRAVVEAGFKQFVALPLRRAASVTGVLCIAARASEALTRPGDLRLLEGIAEWAAIAVENAQLHQGVQDAAVLEERERLAREMHDSLGQVLGYVSAQTLAAKRFLATGQTEQALQELAQMAERVQEVYADVREGILGLRTSSSISEEGLVPALRLYCERYSQMSGVAVEFQVSEQARHAVLSPGVQLQLLRIIQEALTNVRKHAQATAATVSLDADRGLTATVADNGRGFDPNGLPVTGWPRFGLQTMRERAEAVGGTFLVQTEQTKGTTVIVRVPVAPGLA